MLFSDEGTVDSITDLLALIIVLTGFLLYLGSFTSSTWAELRTSRAEMEIESAMDIAMNLKNYILSDGDGMINLERLSLISQDPSSIPVNTTYLYVKIEWQDGMEEFEKGIKRESFLEIKMPVMIEIDELHSEPGTMTVRVVP